MIDIENIRWSFSRINSFDNCPYGWHKTYVLKEKGENNAFAEFGGFCHDILERYALGELMEWDLLDEYTNNFKASINYDFPYNRYVSLEESYYNDGYNYFKNFNGFGNDLEVVGAEIEIEILLEGKYKLIGYIDLLLKNKDGDYIVLDHKSKAKFTNKKEQAEYAKQLYIYSQYVKETYGKFPKLLIFNMFRKGQVVEIPFNETDFEGAINWAIETIEDIGKISEFKAKQDKFFCSNLCNHRNTCDKKLK